MQHQHSSILTSCFISMSLLPFSWNSCLQLLPSYLPFSFLLNQSESALEKTHLYSVNIFLIYAYFAIENVLVSVSKCPVCLHMRSQITLSQYCFAIPFNFAVTGVTNLSRRFILHEYNEYNNCMSQSIINYRPVGAKIVVMS